MGGVGCVLPHPTSEQVGLITLPCPLPVQQVSQGVHGKAQMPSQASQLSVSSDASPALFTLCHKVIITFLHRVS